MTEVIKCESSLHKCYPVVVEGMSLSPSLGKILLTHLEPQAERRDCAISVAFLHSVSVT